jgi:uncharacterized protein (TIGR03435 family)
MAYCQWKRTVFGALAVASVLPAQPPVAPPAPSFEVVSIRPVPPNAPPVNRDWDFTPVLPGGQYIDSRANLLSMISWAYNMKNVNLDVQLVGLPSWAKNQSYSVAAKPADGFPALSPRENEEQVRLMMRSMLADRFHLRLHTETRQERIYKLERSKGGVRLKEVDPPEPPAKGAPVGAAMENDGGIRMVANKSTMASLVNALRLLTGRPVVDETGLMGYYDFDVKWSGPGGQAPETQFRGPELVGLLISNLQTQFGLRLTKAIGPVDYWVVDHVEQPSGN